MPATWVVVADSSAARFFTVGSPTSGLEEIASFAHPEGRRTSATCEPTQPGMTKDRVGYAMHGMEPKVKPKEQEAIAFARLLAERIEAARSKSEIERVILVAPPEFLGSSAQRAGRRRAQDRRRRIQPQCRPHAAGRHSQASAEKLYSVRAPS